MIALEALGRILQRNGVDADSSLTSVFAGRRTIEVVCFPSLLLGSLRLRGLGLRGGRAGGCEVAPGVPSPRLSEASGHFAAVTPALAPDAGDLSFALFIFFDLDTDLPISFLLKRTRFPFGCVFPPPFARSRSRWFPLRIMSFLLLVSGLFCSSFSRFLILDLRLFFPTYYVIMQYHKLCSPH